MRRVLKSKKSICKKKRLSKSRSRSKNTNGEHNHIWSYVTLRIIYSYIKFFGINYRSKFLEINKKYKNLGYKIVSFEMVKYLFVDKKLRAINNEDEIEWNTHIASDAEMNMYYNKLKLQCNKILTWKAQTY